MTGDSPKLGAAGACADLVAGAAAAVADQAAPAAVEQLAMFDAPASRLLSAPEGDAELAARRGRGRPAGSANRSTAELRKWLLAGGVLPQRQMMDWLLLSPEGLAARLGCTKLEAFDRQMSIADKLGRYFMPAMAPSDDQGRVVPAIAMFVGGVATDATGAQPPWARAFEPLDGTVEDQGLSEGGDVASHDSANGEGE